MEELKNFAEISFTNAVLIDIFSKYADNRSLAEFVREDGSISIKFRTNGQIDPPKSCEQVLSLMFALFESNPESVTGRIYMENQKNMLREVVYRLSQVLDGFSNVKMTMDNIIRVKEGPDGEVTQHSEFTLKRTRSTTNETKTG